MECVWNYYYSVTKKMLLLCGQWPYLTKRRRLFQLILSTIMHISIIVGQVGKIIKCDKNLQCIFVCIPTYLVGCIFTLKLYTCQLNNNKIKHLTNQLYSDWKDLESPEEYEIMKTYATRVRVFTLIYSAYYLIGCPMFVMCTLIPKVLDIVLPLNESRPIILPAEIHYFVSDEEYFYYIFILSLICSFFIVNVLAHDCLIMTCIEHICGNLAVVGFRMENLAHNPNRQNNSVDNIYKQKIASSVRLHLRTLEFAKFLESTFSVALVVQMFIIMVAMSITLLQLAVQVEQLIEIMRNLVLVVAQLIHLFCFSMQGQKLIDHSLEIQDKIYNCFWYKIPVKSQRLLIDIMRRSLQPSVLSAGGFYIFSLKSYMTVLQSSVSYYTVLSSFQ
ncbi:Odorant receptor 180 [Nylanderia fulva]|uniref:Odorant receptor n=1 Tax=Nylanderia fulva TaxID=613905 RepID=A0A6G1LPD1_9HYME|nr:Odorant receptor 180 [Nylanderia fulva]